MCYRFTHTPMSVVTEHPLNSKTVDIALSNGHEFSTPIYQYCLVCEVPKLQNIAILLYSAIFLTLFRHWWCILWDDIPPSVPDDIRASQAPEGLPALRSPRLRLQAPQAMKPHTSHQAIKLHKTQHAAGGRVLQGLGTLEDMYKSITIDRSAAW